MHYARAASGTKVVPMRLVIARCTVDYVGRLSAHLPEATRLIMVKADGSVSIHADDRAYKPLNWMTPPCSLKETLEVDLDELGEDPDTDPAAESSAADELVDLDLSDEAPDGAGEDESAVAVAGQRLWVVENPKGEQLRISLHEVISELNVDLGEDPGLEKDGVEAHLQKLLAEHIDILGEGYALVRREYPTAIGPVDIFCRDADGGAVAVEIKRRGGIDGVEQLTRYVELLNRDPLLAPVTGVFAAQEIKPQARTLAEDRGIRCVVLDYDEMRGLESTELRLF